MNDLNFYRKIGEDDLEEEISFDYDFKELEIESEKQNIKTDFSEKLEQTRHEEERKFRRAKRDIENKYDEELYRFEQLQKNNFRIKKEELIGKEKKVEKEIQELEEKIIKKKLEIESLIKEHSELVRKIEEKIGFLEYLEENTFLYRNKLEAVLILRKLKKKNIKILKSKEYETVFRNIVGGVNELIRMNNAIVDYKIRLVKKKGRDDYGI